MHTSMGSVGMVHYTIDDAIRAFLKLSMTFTQNRPLAALFWCWESKWVLLLPPALMPGMC